VIVRASVRPTNNHDYKIRAGVETKIVYRWSQALGILSQPSREVKRGREHGESGASGGREKGLTSVRVTGGVQHCGFSFSVGPPPTLGNLATCGKISLSNLHRTHSDGHRSLTQSYALSRVSHTRSLNNIQVIMLRGCNGVSQCVTRVQAKQHRTDSKTRQCSFLC
jgi:hypothetical protein